MGIGRKLSMIRGLRILTQIVGTQTKALKVRLCGETKIQIEKHQHYKQRRNYFIRISRSLDNVKTEKDL